MEEYQAVVVVNANTLEVMFLERRWCKMGRLTERKGEYCFMSCGDAKEKYGDACPFHNNCYERKIHDKLAHYEDLEEAGRLIEVIRCSECEHYYTVGCADGCGWCSHWDIGRFTDGYCDQAKLKELEGDK